MRGLGVGAQISGSGNNPRRKRAVKSLITFRPGHPQYKPYQYQPLQRAKGIFRYFSDAWTQSDHGKGDKSDDTCYAPVKTKKTQLNIPR